MTQKMAENAIDITVNGAQRSVTVESTLLELVADLTGKNLVASGDPADGSRLGVAVAVDGTVIPRGGWGAHELEPGQTVDIVTAVQGG